MISVDLCLTCAGGRERPSSSLQDLPALRDTSSRVDRAMLERQLYGLHARGRSTSMTALSLAVVPASSS